MAVVEKYADSDLQNDKIGEARFVNGSAKHGAVAVVELESGDSANSIFRMFKGLNPEMVVTSIKISSDALGTSGALNIGLYKSGLSEGAVDADCFAASVDVSSAVLRGDGMAAIDISEFKNKLFEHAGHDSDSKLSSYDLCLTVTNVGATGAGTLALEIEYLV